MITRRNLLNCSAGALLLAPFGHGRAQGLTGAVAVQALNSATAVFSGTGCNALVCKAGNGDLLVVDSGLAAGASDLRRRIEGTLDSRRITTLVNTHWHREQTGLNEVLGNREVRIFSHEITRQWLGTTVKRPWEDTVFAPLPDAALPNETFHHYGDFLHGSDVRVEYGYLRQAHTDGDMYVFLPDTNVLHAGGVVQSDGWPLMDWWTGGWIGGLVDGIETLLSVANDSTVIVPASGPLLNKAELTVMRDMYADLFERIRGLFMGAANVPETLAAKPAAAYEAQYGNADQFIELSHWSLIPHYTPDA